MKADRPSVCSAKNVPAAEISLSRVAKSNHMAIRAKKLFTRNRIFCELKDFAKMSPTQVAMYNNYL